MFTHSRIAVTTRASAIITWSARLTQHELAKRLHKPQSFVAKYEGGERRIDVVEFVTVCQAIGADPAKLLKALVKAIGGASE
jgi:transcriptional regulator with XRE-family HTH domain